MTQLLNVYLRLCVCVTGGSGLLRFSVMSGDSEAQFAIDQDSGVLKVTKPLDREIKSFYNLVIRVEDETKDDHHPPRSATSLV